VAADILSSSAKLADAFIEEKKSDEETKEESPVVEATTPAAPQVIKAINDESDETKVVENALKKETSGEKETLVDDLNAEIEDDEGNFDHLKEASDSGSLPMRSRNGVANKEISLDKDGDEVRTEDLEVVNMASKEPQYDYSMMDELLEFFEQDSKEPILCGYFNKIL
jgi:hypothetical protein